tara:strand:- start:860 stop:1369 length:510 start_codon:yes stop_codon:yes gene_type:complete
MKTVILHLGGTWPRSRTAATLAQRLLDCTVVISSEGSEEKFRQVYQDAGIRQIIHHTDAFDTVSNFTHTYKLLRFLRTERLFVVTSSWHMPRARAIAMQVWGGGRVKELHFVEHPGDRQYIKRDAQYIFADRIRAWIWRRLGIFFYWKKVATQRNAKLNSGHAWLEIPI